MKCSAVKSTTFAPEIRNVMEWRYKVEKMEIHTGKVKVPLGQSPILCGRILSHKIHPRQLIS